MDRRRLRPPCDRPLRLVDRRRPQLVPDVCRAQAHPGQGLRVHLHAHGGLLAAAHEDLADAVHLGDLLRKDVVRGVEHLVERERLARQGDDEGRRVGGVDLAVGRLEGQTGRQLAPRGGDRGLHVSSGRVHVEIEIELEGDRRRPQRVRRCHLREAGDPPEPPLERGGDRRRHRLGARPRKVRAHLDGRKVDARERSHRELRVCQDPREQDRRGEQRSGDRPPDERLRDIHSAGPPAGSAPASRCRRRPNHAPRRSM